MVHGDEFYRWSEGIYRLSEGKLEEWLLSCWLCCHSKTPPWQNIQKTLFKYRKIWLLQGGWSRPAPQERCWSPGTSQTLLNTGLGLKVTLHEQGLIPEVFPASAIRDCLAVPFLRQKISWWLHCKPWWWC